MILILIVIHECRPKYKIMSEGRDDNHVEDIASRGQLMQMLVELVIKRQTRSAADANVDRY